MVRDERGQTMIEVLAAMAVITILCGAALSGGRAHFTEIGRAYDDLTLTEVAASRLEVLTDSGTQLEPGKRSFEVPAGIAATETIREVRPGLYEITVRVTGKMAAPVTLVTLANREVRR